ncbi:MAG: TIM barrel protein [Clostridiales bacterium]|nr:TIM barrel protein [Clostridiales bacterium]
MKAAIQLYSVRDLMEKDPMGTIEQLAMAGYHYIEVANHNTTKDKGIGFGVPADKMKAMLERLGVQVISAHLDPFDDLDALSDYQKTIGNKNVVYSRDFYHNRQEVLDRAYWLNKTGESCAKRGLTLFYHNHFHEFLSFDGEMIMDILAKHTDPDIVKFQLDTFWILRGGQDPAEIIKKYGSRVTMLHQKDFAAGFENDMDMTKKVKPGQYIDRSFYDLYEIPESFTEIGTGIMDIQAIINAGAYVDYIILEQDHSQLNSMDSVKLSKQGFEKFSGIKWI